jgi:ribosomal small subunit protein bTHX
LFAHWVASLKNLFTFAARFYTGFVLKSKQTKSTAQMGKGDFRTKRGKIRRGSHGKSRPKLVKLKTLQKQQGTASN